MSMPTMPIMPRPMLFMRAPISIMANKMANCIQIICRDSGYNDTGCRDAMIQRYRDTRFRDSRIQRCRFVLAGRYILEVKNTDDFYKAPHIIRIEFSNGNAISFARSAMNEVYPGAVAAFYNAHMANYPDSAVGSGEQNEVAGNGIVQRNFVAIVSEIHGRSRNAHVEMVEDMANETRAIEANGRITACI